MADMNNPASDVLDEQAPAIKTQRNPIIKVVVAILKNTNFFKAFTTSTMVHAIYIQQEALQITPINVNNLFVAPPSSDVVIEHVNALGYPSTLRNMYAMTVNALYQPWRAILYMINMCLTGHALGILRSVGKDGTEIFGMPIPDALLTDVIKRAPYYGRYQAHVAKYQKYLEEERSKAEGKAVPEPPKAKVTKLKVSKPASDTAPKPTSSQPPKPTPTSTESTKIIQGKKCKLVKETSDTPSPAKRLKPSKVTKNCMSKSTLKLVDEFIDEGIPVKEPAYLDEEADIKRALELSLKEQEKRTQGPACLMVIRETEYGKFQPLLEVQGKGKENVTDEQAAHDKYPSLDAKPELADSETEYDKPDISVAKETKTKMEMMHTETLVTTSGIQIEGQGGSRLVEEQIILEEHTSSTGTIVSLPQLDKDFNFSDQFLNDKSSDADKEKTHAKAEVQLMVTITIQQDTSSVPPITSQLSSRGMVGQTWVPAIQIGESQYPPEDNYYQAHEDHKNLYEALQKSLERDYSNQLLADLDEAHRKKRKKRDSLRTPSRSLPQQPPPPPPLAGASSAPSTLEASSSSQPLPPPPPSSNGTSGGNQRQGSGAPSLSKTVASTPKISNKFTTLTPPHTDTLMHDDSTLDAQVHLSDDEATRDDHLPNADIRKDRWKPLPEVERPASPEPVWTILSSNMIDIEECHKMLTDQIDWANPEGDQGRMNISSPLPFAGPPGHVTVQTQLCFNKDLDYLRYGNKGSRPSLLISMMNAACYPDFGLELLVPKDMWISELHQDARKSELTCVLVKNKREKDKIRTKPDQIKKKREA
nr:hypothetical protein [Tanacetum cinerariifolium]